MLPWLRPTSAGRHAWWISLPLVLVTGLVFKTHRPQRPPDTICFSIAVVFAWVLTFNSVLALRRMTIAERIAFLAWFALVSILAVAVLVDAFTTRGWADR
jgi:hypothetical protein